MKYDKFFELAKQAGIEEAELHIDQSYRLDFSLFHGEVVKYSNNNAFSIVARGKYNGKFATATSDVFNSVKAKFLVDEIVKNAKIIEDTDPIFIYEGSPKYKKISTFNKSLELVSIDEKMAKLHQLEEKVKSLDPRIVEIQTTNYSESMGTTSIINTKGLKLSQKSNYFAYACVVVAKQGEQVKTGYDLFFDNDFSKFDVDDLAKKVVEAATSQLGGEACPSGKYKAVLSPEVVSNLMGFYISSASAEEIQKNSSLFLGKLGQKIASSKITIEDRPLSKNIFAKSFDDEGVATNNRAIIKKGVLETYLYNLTTASKDGVASTGNAVLSGKMGIAPNYLFLKPGKKSQEQLFEDVGNGVYITEVSGLHAGMNPQSGNFSLQSTGFLIKDGKKDRPLDLITVSGNLMDIFKDVVAVGSDLKEFSDATSAPSLQIKKLAVTGK